MKKSKKCITIDRDTYEMMRRLHLLPLDVDVEITGKGGEKEDEHMG